MSKNFSATAKQKFNYTVKTLLSPSTKQEIQASNSILAFISRTINQFGLKGSIEIGEIINESYIRGIKFIEKNGEEIANVDAFIKRISINVIREIARKSKKSIAVEPTIIEEGWEQNYLKEEVFLEKFSDEEIKKLSSILQELTPLDFSILHLQVVEKLKAKEVVNFLKHEHFISEENIRQKKRRILAKIKKEMDN